MQQVFLSYTGVSREAVQILAASLRGMGWSVFDYWNSPSTNPKPSDEDIKRFLFSAYQCDAFVQIIESGLGHKIAERNDHILPLELEQYCLSRDENRDKPRPLIVSVFNESLPTETLRYINKLENARHDVKLVDDKQEAAQTIVQWLSEIRSTRSRLLINGVFDTRLAERGVDEAFRGAFRDERLFPQKFLYMSPVGGLLWKNLVARDDSSLGRMWRLLPFSAQSDPLPARILRLLPRRNLLSVLALGCGDGGRESQVAANLSQWLAADSVEVLLADASKTLIADAYTNFRNRVHGMSVDIQFALIDFEHASTLQAVRSRLSTSEPCLVQFLGNTLGNISFRNFLGDLGSALLRNDILLLEIAMASDEERRIASAATPGASLPAPEDERFEFITNPIRFFGLSPERKKFAYRYEQSRYGVRRVYEYTFDANDEEHVSGTAFASLIRRGHRLDLISIESFDKDKLLGCLRDAGFGIADDTIQIVEGPLRPGGGSRLQLGYVVAVKT